MQKNKDKWEETFDKLWHNDWIYTDNSCKHCKQPKRNSDDVKQFISNLLKAERKRAVKIVKKVEKEYDEKMPEAGQFLACKYIIKKLKQGEEL